MVLPTIVLVSVEVKDLLSFNAEKAGKETFSESSTCVVSSW